MSYREVERVKLWRRRWVMPTVVTKVALTFLFVAMASVCRPSVDIAQADPVVRYVKVTNLSPGHILLIRSAPIRSSDPIGILPYSARHIRSYGCKTLATGSWCEVRYRGTRGWASKRYLAPDKRRRA